MKKVIQSGRRKERSLVCNHCDCQFLSDEYSESKLPGREQIKISDKCPECKRKVEFVEEI